MFSFLLAAAVPIANAGENPIVQRVRDYWRQVWSEGNLRAVAEF